MNLLKKYTLYILLLVVIIGSYLFVFDEQNIDVTKRTPEYDEWSWAGASIATYYMFNGYQRKNVRDDSWFTNYAYQNKLDIFKPIRSRSLEIDFNKIAPKKYQWFDFTLWTAGWKAPNFSKLVKGWYINLKVDTLNPESYYELGNESKGESSSLYYSRVPAKFVEYGRHVDASFSFLSLVLIFILGWQFFNYAVGVFSWVYLLLNKNFIKVTTAAGMDSSLFFFSLLSILFLHILLKQIFKENSKWKTTLGLSIGLGLSMGLAVSSKLNGATLFVSLIILAPIILFIVWKRIPNSKKLKDAKANVLKRRERELKKLREKYFVKWGKTIFIVAPSIAIFSLGTYIYCNPHMWPDLSKKITIVRQSADDFFGLRAKALNTTHIKENWRESFKLVMKTNFLLFDEKDKGFLGTFGHRIPTSWRVFDLFFLLIGLFVLFKSLNKSLLKEPFYDPSQLILVTYFVVFYMNTNFIWIRYNRYFVPLYNLGSIIISLGIVTFINLAYTKFKLILVRNKA